MKPGISERIVSRDHADRTPFLDAGVPNRVVMPTEEEAKKLIEQFSGNNGRLCGHCRNFNLQLGQEEYVREQHVFELAFNELQHDPAWYGRTDMFGACAAYDGHMAHAFSPCKVPRHYYDSSVPYAGKDEPTDCVDFAPRQAGVRSSRMHFIGMRRTYEGG